MIADIVACIESTVWGEVFLLLSIGLELDNFPSHFTEKFWSYICRGYHQMGCFRHRYLVRWWFCRKYTKKKFSDKGLSIEKLLTNWTRRTKLSAPTQNHLTSKGFICDFNSIKRSRNNLRSALLQREDPWHKTSRVGRLWSSEDLRGIFLRSTLRQLFTVCCRTKMHLPTH